jgi:hypothetical protein
LIALVILFFRGWQGYEANIQRPTSNAQYPATDFEHLSHQDRKERQGPILKELPHFVVFAIFCKIPVENRGAPGGRALPRVSDVGRWMLVVGCWMFA